ncbi:MAG: hypothetical protein ABI083_14920 [Lapillicoccus sp.]
MSTDSRPTTDRTGGAAMAAAPMRVAFIGGHGRSGSTLLARLLGSVDGVFSAGEVCYIWEQGVLRDRICSCGEPFSRCELWQAVGDVAFGGWTTQVAREGLALRKEVDRNRHVARLARPQLFPAYHAKLEQYAEMYGRVHRGIKEASGAAVVVDTSKNPSTGYLLRQMRGGGQGQDVDLRAVHLVRDVRGVAYSWAKVVSRPDRDGAPMTRLSPGRTTVEWTAFNAMVEGLGLLGVPRVLTRYEDLIAAPEATVRSLLAFLDVPTGAETLSFIQGSTVTLPPGHEVTGNVMRFRSGAEQLRLDEEWKAAMSPRRRAAITALGAPGLARYGYLGGAGSRAV